ncbi:MAG: hypothetical protein HPY79_06895 [Bacteroidales bacterium]|nr:hypothetical protein [Bacteroidales bacterium]
MLLIYTHHITPRLTFIVEYLFLDVAKVHFKLTENKLEYEAYQGPKISYTQQIELQGAWLYASNLLFETNLNHVLPSTAETIWGKALFKSPSPQSLAPFDVFAACFWLVSRYEEYTIEQKDKHDRFDYHYSWLFKNKLLQTPLVNLWTDKLLNQLKWLFPNLEIAKSKYHSIFTFDIDNLFAFKGKKLIHSVLAIGNAIIKKRFDLVTLRWQYLTKKIKDPYDTYTYIINQCAKFQHKPIFFILTGKTSQYDRNLKSKHPLFIKTVKELNSSSMIGLHLSYNSELKKTIKLEKETLEHIINKKIEHNRFHFLRFNIPYSYVSLSENNILYDFSMGYTQADGYRAGTCTPFYFFDLINNTKTNVKIYPFPFMDRTWLINKLSPESALIKSIHYIEEIKKYNGTFVSLWHNETLQDNIYGQPWKEIFEKILDAAK